MFKTLFLVIAVVAGGLALYPQWRAAHQAPPQLTIRYKAGSPATAAVARPWLEVVNTSPKRVLLSDVAIRYYFTADGTSSYAFNCVQAAVGCSNIAGETVAPADPATTADRYLQISFTPGAGSLAPGAKSGAIGLQLYRPDGRKLDQRDDRSFNAAATTFQPSKTVTGYLRGAHVWGDEPTSPTRRTGSTDHAAAPARASSAPRPRPAHPRGIMFDNFHYSGPDDPALHAHGWLVRTSPGGPGIHDTWSAAGVTFPAEKTAVGGQVLQLRASTDGTKAGTKQAEVQSSGTGFMTGTYAARIYFNDKPTSGRNGDHVNESFYTISPDNSRYSELDNEYMPNGGWGAPGPKLDTTSWYSADTGDRVTHKLTSSLQGWHTMMITAVHGVATYSVDGHKLFSSGGKYFPRQNMSINFNTWFVDLPFTGPRTWDMRVNWFYYKAGKAQSLTDVQKAVNNLYDSGTHYINTVPKS
ncbi:cellulose binding domain-containing protein [Streptomyces sp. NBC_00316]|uniref:cellulose binding domain-containing protein n=1 Tax=Streptomyces sp. NBC_00316 TaxID=2975710 RepID=UPI002E27EDB4|nr:cellulose binding domain-containing protein [Streptomyces sp. NBC_00316]